MAKINFQRISSAVVLFTALVGGGAFANTLNQNVTWTITRTGAVGTYRMVAYGDSIYAGYNGSTTKAARRAAPNVDGEYLGKKWNANLEVVRRTKSGAKADDIYNNKIIAEKSYMQAASTRVVMFEMCGNDFLQARSDLNGQSGTCNFGVLDTALANCTYYQERAMQAINTYATSAKLKIVSTIFYPGYDADNVLTSCTDSSGARVNKQQKFLPYLAKSNWRACNLAAQYGFACADSFAEFMGADYDSNGDGQVDSAALRYIAGESEADYVNRISVALRSTIRDSNLHMVSSSTSYDYIQSDNTHPTYYLSATVTAGLFGGTTGSGVADFTDAQVVGGKNPVWNQYGHERMGWINSIYNPAAP